MPNQSSSSESTKGEIPVGLYRRIVEGLEQKPAYLLVFAISALFVLSGLGSSITAIVHSDLQFGILAVVSFALALIAAVVVVRQVERNGQDTTSEARPPITDLESLLLKYLNEYFYPHTPKAIASEAPKITMYQEVGNYSIEEVRLVLDALVARNRVEKQTGPEGEEQYSAFD